MTTVHLNTTTVPETVALLNALLRNRNPLPNGYAPDRQGATIDWDQLATGQLSNSERAVVFIARGLALLEAQGGRFELGLRDQILAAVQTVVEVP